MEIPQLFKERYQVVEEVARRTSSVVLKAVDTQSERTVAVKVFTDSPVGNQEWIQRFFNECTVLQSLQHPNIVSVIDYGLESDLLYLVMHFVEGQTVREVLRTHGAALDANRSVLVVESVAKALEAMRAAGIHHGHVDSRAVLISRENDVVQLAGFFPSTISIIRKSLTSAGGFIVDPAYISPEQVSGSSEPDYRSDMYSLGVLLFEMLCGQKPFTADNAFQTAMLRVVEEPPSPSQFQPSILPMLDAAVVKALSRSVESRFQSFTDFIDALHAGIGSKTGNTVSQDSASRLGTETVGVGISTEDIRRLLQQRDQEDTTAEHKAPTSLPPLQVPKAATVGVEGRLSSDEGATMVGAVDVKDLPASFMVIDGPKRGKRFIIDSGQCSVGSDPSCSMRIDDRGVPARFVLIARKGDSYEIVPFAGVSVEINGQVLDGEREYVLVRGDVLTVGPNRLRFVAPGEVFTLQDEIADRVVDRPQSKVGSVLKVATIALAGVCVLVLVLFWQGLSNKNTTIKKNAVTKAAEQKQLIAKLRQEGDLLFKEGSLIEPVGANARTRFEQILEIDPNDTYAKRRLAEIKNRVAAQREQRRSLERKQQQIDELLAAGKQYLSQGALVSPPGANAKESFQAVLQLDSANTEAQSAIRDIDTRLATMVGEVSKLLERAKVLREQGAILAPEDENAFALVKRIFQINPGNPEAKDLLLDMAAESIYRGDAFKKRANPEKMRQQYLQAQLLGVDPEYLAPRMRGVDLMKRSKAGVIIYDGNEGDGKTPPSSAEGYLSSAEIDRRIAAWTLKEQVVGGAKSDRFIDLGR